MMIPTNAQYVRCDQDEGDEMVQIEATWHPERVLAALGRIGYDPAAAVMDIVDNSVSWEAERVTIDLGVESDSPARRGRSRTRLNSVTVV